MRSTLIACCLSWWWVAGTLAAPVAQNEDTATGTSGPQFPEFPEFPEIPDPPSPPQPLSTVFTEFQDGSETLTIPVVRFPNDTGLANGVANKVTDGKEFLVLLEDDQKEGPAISKALSDVGASIEGPDVSHIFDNSIFRGFSGRIGSAQAERLNALKSVKLVEPVKEITGQVVRSREGSPWGLQRISQDGPVVGLVEKLDFTYTFDDDGSMGRGVDIYVLDSGINTDHRAFGGRARMGFSKDGPGDLNAQSDGDGHGTHAAATAAGDVLGVARGANVIGVKVMGADRVGTTADALKGLDWVIKQHDQRKSSPDFVGSVASISWSVPERSQLIDRAVDAAVDAGVHVSVAAGNRGEDACTTSPASQGGAGAEGQGGKAVTVGSVNVFDIVSDFSNTGACVDVYAPGEAVISAWVGGTETVEIQDGTSMACPFVSGLMAYMMVQNRELAQSPKLMKETLKQSSVPKGLLPNRGDKPGLPDMMPVVNNGIGGKISQQRQLGFKNLNDTLPI